MQFTFAQRQRTSAGEACGLPRTRHDRHSVVGEGTQHRQDSVARQQVHAERGLVYQQNPWLQGQGPGDTHTNTLLAVKLARSASRTGLRPCSLQGSSSAAPGECRRHPTRELADREMVESRVALAGSKALAAEGDLTTKHLGAPVS